MRKKIFTTGEIAVWKTALEIAKETSRDVCAKMRIADALEIENSGISNDLYRYALSAHFDVLLLRNYEAELAIEFDGSGHDPRNDERKNALCNHFGLPLVRVNNRHLNSRNFEDDAVGFLIHQWCAVDAFLEQFGNEPDEPYDPAHFISVPGKQQQFPFAYSSRWRNRLLPRLKANADMFPQSLRNLYAHGLINMGSFEGTWEKDGHFRSICGIKIDDDHAVWAIAELGFEVHGLVGNRHYFFMKLDPFVAGLAAERMFEKAIGFLEGHQHDVTPLSEIAALNQEWTREGFYIRGGSFNIP